MQFKRTSVHRPPDRIGLFIRALVRNLVYVALSLALPDSTGYSFFRQSKETKPPSASISGRVTLNGNPAPGVPVILTRNDMNDDGTAIAKATTDEEGRFRIPEAPAGSFRLTPFAPAFVIDDRAAWGQPGKLITILSSEAIEGIDLALRHGGVITGKVTDSAGRPVVEERVTLSARDDKGKQHGFSQSWESGLTDDRGVYRIFGVSAGRYIASVGVAPRQGRPPLNGNTYYPMTFHPGVTDDSKAEIIDLAPGAEATGIDIALGRPAKAYTAVGLIVDAETGKPLSNISYAYGIRFDGRGVGMLGSMNDRSDAQGGFRLEGLTPNHYAAFAVQENDSEYYGDVAAFDISEADVTGLEIKMHRGSSISGVAVIEGMLDRDMAEKLTAVRILAVKQSTGSGSPFSSYSRLGADGSFRIAGLPPGKVRLVVQGTPSEGLALTRVERGGIEQRDGSIDIAAGEQASDLRLTIVSAAGVIRGQLKITGGALPPGTRFSVRLRRVGNERPDFGTETDDRYRFLLEGLPPGDYELIAAGYIPAAPGGQPSRLQEARQAVTVTNDVVAEVTLVIDLSAKDK